MLGSKSKLPLPLWAASSLFSFSTLSGFELLTSLTHVKATHQPVICMEFICRYYNSCSVSACFLEFLPLLTLSSGGPEVCPLIFCNQLDIIFASVLATHVPYRLISAHC